MSNISTVMNFYENPDMLNYMSTHYRNDLFTSPILVNKMLDLLPEELFTNPTTTFLDPCCRSGVFLSEITKRLIQGLKKEIPDIQERVDHILTKQVFGITVTELDSLISRRSVYGSKIANGKYSICTKFEDTQGNIIFPYTEHILGSCICTYCDDPSNNPLIKDLYLFKRVFKKSSGIKFDVVVGNFPHELIDSRIKGHSKSIFNSFVNQLIDLNPKFLTMIVPPQFITEVNEVEGVKNGTICNKKILAVHNFIDIGSEDDVNYFLWNSDLKNACTMPVVSDENILSYYNERMKIFDMSLEVKAYTQLLELWKEDLLVNIEYDVLKDLLDDENLMQELMTIDGFESLKDDLIYCVNKYEIIDKVKKEFELVKANSVKQKNKEINRLVRDLENKKSDLKILFKKLLCRIPLFMYLTDTRERCLIDVIFTSESELFVKVMGYNKETLKKLLNLNLYNKECINVAIYSFRRYETRCLDCSVINRHEVKIFWGC